MIKKVLLINPPNTLPEDSLRRIFEPIGLLYIAALLKKNGFEVSVFDMACEGYDNCVLKDGYVTYGSSPEELRKKIFKINPDIIGISCAFTARQKDTFNVCKTIRQINKNLTIVAGGLHASLYPERFLENDMADYVILGEGEFRFLELLKCLNNNQEIIFDGIAYKLKDSVKINPMINRIENLDTLPFPDRDLIDMEKYIKIGVPFAPFSYKQRVAQILATRGCPHKCVFCSSSSFWGRKIRARSVDNIINEMKTVIKKYAIEEIQFVDDLLTFNRDFSKELFAKMKDLNIKWCTPNGLMFNTLDAELIKLMAESGAYQLTFAIESGSERVLKEIIHKKVNLKIVKHLIEEAHKYDISVHGTFIVGFPGEKKEEIMETLDFPFKAGFDSASFFMATPIPGSELYALCAKNKYITTENLMDLKKYYINIPEESPDYVMKAKELEQLVDKKTREFNEWAKKTYPQRWDKKFKQFLKNHPEEKNAIQGRVT